MFRKEQTTHALKREESAKLSRAKRNAAAKLIQKQFLYHRVFAALKIVEPGLTAFWKRYGQKVYEMRLESLKQGEFDKDKEFKHVSGKINKQKQKQAHLETVQQRADELGEEVPYWQQFNADMYTEENAQNRLKCRWDALFLKEIDVWLQVLPSPIDENVYYEMSEALTYACCPDTQVLMMDMEADWKSDSQGHLILNKSRLADSLFELADLWVPTHVPADYAAYIRTVLQQMCPTGKWAERIRPDGFSVIGTKREMPKSCKPCSKKEGKKVACMCQDLGSKFPKPDDLRGARTGNFAPAPFAGVYQDPKHPGGYREVLVDTSDKVTIRGVDKSGGKAWKISGGEIAGDNLTIDMSTKGLGPGEVATYQRNIVGFGAVCDGIRFSNRMLWTKMAPFGGTYVDPEHPMGTREIKVNGDKATIKGTNDSNGKTWTAKGKMNGNEIYVDFSLAAKFEDQNAKWDPKIGEKGGLRFKDGTVWMKAKEAEPKVVKEEEKSGSPADEDGEQFEGCYMDPQYPDAQRMVIVEDKKVTITGIDFPDGPPWKAEGSIMTGDSMLVDFSAKGGPKDEHATYEPSTGQIRFGDGTIWTKVPPDFEGTYEDPAFIGDYREVKFDSSGSGKYLSIKGKDTGEGKEWTARGKIVQNSIRVDFSAKTAEKMGHKDATAQYWNDGSWRFDTGPIWKKVKDGKGNDWVPTSVDIVSEGYAALNEGKGGHGSSGRVGSGRGSRDLPPLSDRKSPDIGGGKWDGSGDGSKGHGGPDGYSDGKQQDVKGGKWDGSRDGSKGHGGPEGYSDGKQQDVKGGKWDGSRDGSKGHGGPDGYSDGKQQDVKGGKWGGSGRDGPKGDYGPDGYYDDKGPQTKGGGWGKEHKQKGVEYDERGMLDLDSLHGKKKPAGPRKGPPAAAAGSSSRGSIAEFKKATSQVKAQNRMVKSLSQRMADSIKDLGQSISKGFKKIGNFMGFGSSSSNKVEPEPASAKPDPTLNAASRLKLHQYKRPWLFKPWHRAAYRIKYRRRLDRKMDNISSMAKDAIREIAAMKQPHESLLILVTCLLLAVDECFIVYTVFPDVVDDPIMKVHENMRAVKMKPLRAHLQTSGQRNIIPKMWKATQSITANTMTEDHREGLDLATQILFQNLDVAMVSKAMRPAKILYLWNKCMMEVRQAHVCPLGGPESTRIEVLKQEAKKMFGSKKMS